jgi:DNA-binding beta-propeller fold protein YncE
MSRSCLCISMIIGFGILAGGCGNDMRDNLDPDAAADAASADGSQNGDPDSGMDPGESLPPLGPGVVTLAGGAEAGDLDGVRDMAGFRNPVNVAVGGDGMIYVADFDNSLVRRVTPDGVVTTLTSGNPKFSRPFGLAVAPEGTVYIQTDFNSNGTWGAGALWALAPGDDTIELLMDDIGRTRGLLALPDGRLAMSSFVDHVIQIFDPGTRSITHLAGGRGSAGYRDGSGVAARFHTPYGLALLGNGNIVVADRGNHRLRMVTLDGRVTTLAGDGMEAVKDGPLLQASFNMPQGLASDGASTIYVSSINGYVIHRIEDGQVVTIAGDGTPGFADTEDPLQAQFFGLEGIATSPDAAYLYIADGSRGEDAPHHRIRRVMLE